jgi:hypothetical protein
MHAVQGFGVWGLLQLRIMLVGPTGAGKHCCFTTVHPGGWGQGLLCHLCSGCGSPAVVIATLQDAPYAIVTLSDEVDVVPDDAALPWTRVVLLLPSAAAAAAAFCCGRRFCCCRCCLRSGKSTLLKLMLGDLEPTRGTVTRHT